MKTKSLLLLVPVAVLALTYLAWRPGTPDSAAALSGGKEMLPPAATQPRAVAASKLAAPTTQLANPGVPGCTPVTQYLAAGDGTAVELLSCEPTDPAEQHPYESYASAALESLAYADAKAAEILGMRLRKSDQARAVSLILRSSALSGGDITPILRFSQAYPEPSAIDGVPVRKTIHTKYVLSAVADLLGSDTQYAVPWENEIRRYSSDPDKELAMLQARARQIVAEMRQIELDVTGSSTTGGQGDA
ncbi:MAG: hypothetical protein OEW64_02040 [Gammaproteobacteria bacterium]|nr:hypothetical protein [Gammaproteobacteria bacterium]MDH5302860.1 hypothetical protein [Gammaproteobacteria bacterium]MDH5323017.1 hypothetical protein [Gammaproteobacteria bacterium]